MIADSGPCGCPTSTANCNNNCKVKVPGSTNGRCNGFLFMTCECWKDGDWINIANKC